RSSTEAGDRSDSICSVNASSRTRSRRYFASSSTAHALVTKVKAIASQSVLILTALPLGGGMLDGRPLVQRVVFLGEAEFEWLVVRIRRQAAVLRVALVTDGHVRK